MSKFKLELVKIKKHIKEKEPKKVTSIRLTKTDKHLLINNFGSVQKAIDALLKEIKGEF